MYIETVPNRNSNPTILLRESFRDEGKVKKRTLANLTKLPGEIIEGMKKLLKGATVVEKLEQAFEVARSLPHGHVAAVLGTIKKLKLGHIIGSEDDWQHPLVLAMIAARIIDPKSKLATARGLDNETASNSLAQELGVDSADEEALYQAMDWLLERQANIETKLARRHLKNGSLVLYDVTSTYFEGRTCPLARIGYNRDQKKGKLQIVFGLLCDVKGCPIAVEVFEGDTGDPSTLQEQIRKIRERFGLERIILVGDRGMITQARIENDLKPAGLDWVTALRAPQIQQLVASGAIQLSLFDEQDLGEITSTDYPGERLIVCRNPRLAVERARKREDLLAATEKQLEEVVQATRRAKRPLRGKDRIGLRVGKVVNRYKVGKHFHLDIQEEGFSYRRNQASISKEASLDGIYVVRTTVPAKKLEAEEVVSTYKSLSHVEQAFRSYKSVDLKVRPIHHRLAGRVKAHVFLCMLAYYVEWHMRQALAPILFDDDDREAAKAKRGSVVAPAQRSPSAKRKAKRKRTDDNYPVHSFQTLLTDLATISKDRIKPNLPDAPQFDKITVPTRVQQRALDLLRVRL
ncbi:MAG: IS1634 family transposase [Desulfoferrobacter sp.]